MSSTPLTNSDTPAKPARNSSVELLRILAMCGVVILHYNNQTIGGGLRYASGAGYSALFFLESLFICAVNLYVLISGYFMCTSQKRSLSKPFALLVQVCVFSAGIYLVRCIVSGGFSLKSLVSAVVPNNYFVILYVTLYLISPYINLVLKKLTDKQFHVLVVLLLTLFSLWPTLVDMLVRISGRSSFSGLSTINAFDSQRGYTIVQFVLMYVLGAYIRRNEQMLRKLPALVMLAGCVAAICGWAALSTADAWAYSNPFVILCACFALLIALGRPFQSKLINRLAAGAFTCFLLHDLFIHHIGIEKAATSSLPILLAHVILSAIGIYLVCWFAYWVWDLVTKPLFRFAEKRFAKLDPLFSITEPKEP